MAGSRTLKLSILADVDDLRQKLGDGSKEVEGFGGKLGNFGKKAGVAFAAAGAAAAAYAGTLLVDGVKSAIEDEKAQAQLAGTLERVVGATKDQVAAVEEYISKTAIAKGFTDDELRPSFDRLVRSTKDTEEAQSALSLAMDISAATGKSLETVSNAVAKAADGNASSLARLTGGFESSEIKGKTLSDLMPTLAERFGGAADKNADTFAGKMERLGIAFSEAKETAGSFILDAITPLVTAFVDKVIPALQSFGREIGEKLGPIFDSISATLKDVVLPAFIAYYNFVNEKIVPIIRDIAVPIFQGLSNIFKIIKSKIVENKDSFVDFYDAIKPVFDFIKKYLVPILSGNLKIAFTILGKAIGPIIDAFSGLLDLITGIINAIGKMISFVANSKVGKAIGGLIENAFGGARAEGGPVNAGKSYLVGERGAELFVPRTNGMIVPNRALGGGGTTNININVSGALDKEGVARQIVDLLNDSFYRGTLASASLKV